MKQCAAIVLNGSDIIKVSNLKRKYNKIINNPNMKILEECSIEKLDEKIALVFANSAGKVVYYATILHAHNLKIIALLDSDSAGDQAAQQENLVHTLGNKNILRTKDFCVNVPKAEIEDLLRETLIIVANEEYSVNVKSISDAQPTRPIIDIFSKEIPNF